MRRLIAGLTALFVVLGGNPVTPVAQADAQTSCCWLYCESFRDLCSWTASDDRDYCDAWYEGCIDGCQYPSSSESGAF